MVLFLLERNDLKIMIDGDSSSSLTLEWNDEWSESLGQRLLKKQMMDTYQDTNVMVWMILDQLWNNDHELLETRSNYDNIRHQEGLKQCDR